ncbi:hypothetical protein ACIPO9_03915 [Pseudomonas sp. NPDC090203]|uniref:hypothetical protein n=1 Tax=Pseudomonas sp. NPDC090203 TaxID=3364477 RepID=UPI003801876D
MHDINLQLNQLPYAIRAELTAHVGDTSGFTAIQRVAHHRAVANNLIAYKRSLYEPLAPGDEMAGVIADMLQGTDLSFITGPAHQPFPRWATHEIIKYLQVFVNNLAPVQTRLEQEAHQRAVQAAQEAARIAAQRQAEEAERRRIQEEAARLQAQREAEAAARLAAEQAARLLATQQAEAAARALAQRKAEEAALEEARMALALAEASMPQPATPAEANDGNTEQSAEHRPAREIFFIPGPAAMAEIDRATLALKHSIDAAVAQYASAIGPYLNTSPALAATAR